MKSINVCILVAILLIVSSCSIVAGMAMSRTNIDCELIVDCNYNQFDYVFEEKFPIDGYHSYNSFRVEWENKYRDEL